MTLEDVLGSYNQSNFDVASAAAAMRSLAKDKGITDDELAAAVPVFGDEHRAALNSGYTEGSNYNVIAQRAVADAMKQKGDTQGATDFTNSTADFVKQGADQAQQRWQGTQEDDGFSFGSILTMAAIAVAAYFTGGAALAAMGGEAAAAGVGGAALAGDSIAATIGAAGVGEAAGATAAAVTADSVAASGLGIGSAVSTPATMSFADSLSAAALNAMNPSTLATGALKGGVMQLLTTGKVSPTGLLLGAAGGVVGSTVSSMAGGGLLGTVAGTAAGTGVQMALGGATGQTTGATPSNPATAPNVAPAVNNVPTGFFNTPTPYQPVYVRS